ncbi:hypothetical protein BC939DRAFT_222654 [Gamsiella multidivaricata]|uniref:uncharacterized protein n=1 Tax=Gamsiella multidivaricata TaxID=101098 RepID=UPI00221F0A43|nr:uncharacterized protein BC939DRAFT_222654 [Gamsiella multidivaricata]KAI7831188.1 hypothetical protein BC939DRAFT_222654 [Gamsiella multidivaricata]
MRAWSTPILRPMAPFFIGGAITFYIINGAQETMLKSTFSSHFVGVFMFILHLFGNPRMKQKQDEQPRKGLLHQHRSTAVGSGSFFFILITWFFEFSSLSVIMLLAILDDRLERLFFRNTISRCPQYMRIYDPILTRLSLLTAILLAFL